MKATPCAAATHTPITASVIQLSAFWLGLAVLASALGFTPDLEHRLQSPEAGAYSQFGTAVDLDGDTAVVGCPGFAVNNAWVGAAYVFVSRDGQWLHQATLIPEGVPADTSFGSAVAISGDTIVVGAYRDPGFGRYSGTVYVFTRVQDVWTLETKLNPADAQSYLQFGDPVAIHGDRIAIGALGDGEMAAVSGAVYLFHRDQNAWQQEAKLKSRTPAIGALFGFALSLNDVFLAVGAPFHTHSSLTSAGSASLFQQIDGEWTEAGQFTAADASANSLFGWSIAVTANQLLVGAPLAREGTLSPGAAYRFQQVDSAWFQTGKIADSIGANNAWFGFSVALHENTIAVGASQDSQFGASAGAICLFSTQSDLWQQTHKINASSMPAGAQFGFDLAYDGNHLIAGAPFYDEAQMPLVGAAFVFSPAAPPSQLTFDDLLQLLWDLPMPAGQSQALGQFLKNARRALEQNRPSQAIHHLQIARNYLRVHSGGRLDPTTVQTLDTALGKFAESLQTP